MAVKVPSPFGKAFQQFSPSAPIKNLAAANNSFWRESGASSQLAAVLSRTFSMFASFWKVFPLGLDETRRPKNLLVQG